jgi:hypothetical protein
MALFQYEGIGSLRSLGNRLTTQRAVYSYNQFSIVNYEELDYGSITDIVLEAEDYGEITASIEQYYQIQDFGTITLDTARIPMGKVGVHLAATDSTMRVSVGGVEFALYGRAITEVFFNPVDRVFDFQGESVNRITSSWLGRGVLPILEEEALDVVVATPPTSILHLSVSGKAQTEVIFNQQDRIFDIIGEAEESRTYLFDEEDAIDFRSDDWGFLTEAVLRSEDYGDVNYNQTLTGDPFTIEPEDLLDPSYLLVSRFSSIENGGTGISQSGGFNIGPHIRLSGPTVSEAPPFPYVLDSNENDRYFEFVVDSRYLDRVTYEVIRGNNSNGGFGGHSAGEELYLQYFDGQSWQDLDNTGVLLYSTLGTRTVSLPSSAQNYGQRFRFIQKENNSRWLKFFGSPALWVQDSTWGIRNIQFEELSVGTGLSEDDFGLISLDVTTKVHGRMPFSGSSEERFIFANYDGSWGNKQPRLLGTGIDYTIPKHIGEGFINIDGTPRVQIRMHYKADGGWDFYPNRFRGGSLFGFANGAETSVFTESTDGKLFTIKSSTTFKAVRDEVGKSEKDLLVQGGAFYEVIFNQVDRVFSFANIEINRRAYAYNISSVVNVEGIDYGYITDTVSLSEDYGDVGNHDLVYPWETEDFGTLAPTETRIPFGLGRLYSTTETPRVRRFVGNQENTHLRLLGTSKIYVLPKFTSKGDLFNIHVNGIDSKTNDEVGTGSLFGFSSTTDSTLVQPPIDESQQRIFTFTGELIEKFGKGNYTGSGTLFGYSSTTEARLLRDGFGELFNIEGQVEEKFAFSEVGSGTLGGFDGAAESFTFSYNEDSGFGACDGEDYGFINESVYNVDESPSLSGFLSTPISTLASEVVSEYGRSLNAIDFGNVNQYYQYNHEDYGNLHPDDCLEPMGVFAFRSGVDESRTKIFIGSGKIGSVSGAAEAIGVRPPSISLFAFRGGGTESTTPATEIGSGSIFSFISFTETATFSENTPQPLFAIDGGLRISAVNEQESELKFTASWLAEGRLFGFDGSGEATGQEETGSGTIFIRDSGLRIEPESFTPWIPPGSGSIFSFVSFTETAAFSEQTPQPLFAFSGAATNIQFSYAWETTKDSQFRLLGNASVYVLPKHLGSGSFFVRSSGVRIEPESFTPWIPPGTGSLFGYVGAAEATGSNPPDNFTLFNIVGEVDTPLLTFSEQKFVQARFLPDEAFTTFQIRVTETGLQPLDIEGKLEESFTPAPAVATGSLFGFSSTTEARVINPPDQTTLFTFVGNAAESETNVEIGSGSIFSFQSSAEVTAVSEVKTALFSFAGNLEESVSPAPHVTTGGLFGFSSTTEARVIDLPARTILFSIGGTAVERASVAEEGTQTPGLDVNGSLVERSTFAHAGSGGLFGFSSTTEARVIVPRGLRNLFTVIGSGEQSITVPETGSGSIFGFVGASESKSNAEVNTTLFTVTGTPIVKFVGSNIAVGQIRVGLSNPGIPGDLSRGITVFRLRTFPQGPVVKFSGTKKESFTPAPHIAEGLVNINRGDEITDTRYIEFRKGQPTRIVVI